MFETCKEATDNNKAFGVLLTDLSKAFDCLSVLTKMSNDLKPAETTRKPAEITWNQLKPPTKLAKTTFKNPWRDWDYLKPAILQIFC